MFLGVKSGRRVGLTTLAPYVSRMSENVGASTSRNPKDLHGQCRDNFTFLPLPTKASTLAHILVYDFPQGVQSTGEHLYFYAFETGTVIRYLSLVLILIYHSFRTAEFSQLKRVILSEKILFWRDSQPHNVFRKALYKPIRGGSRQTNNSNHFFYSVNI
jgi:hypothetical protein